MNAEQLLRDTLQRQADRSEHDPTPVEQVAWRAARIQRTKRTRTAAATLVAAAAVTALAMVAPATLTPDREPDPLEDDQTLAVEDADTIGDMVMVDDPRRAGGSEEGFVPAPERALNDISNTTLSHGVHRVAVEVDFVDLKKQNTGGGQSLFVSMKTNEGADLNVDLQAWGRDWSGQVGVYGDRDRCPVQHSIDYETNLIKVSLPRECLSNPDWVRFRIRADASGDDGHFADDALSDVATYVQDSSGLEQSSRVHHETSN